MQQSTNVFDPYATLVWSGVMPNIRAAVSAWNPRNHQPMAALLDAWAPLLPSFTLDNILEQLILPRIQQCVDHWDPLTDTIPIHIWILPWTGLLGHKMDECVYNTIRDKLGNALMAWLPQDRSARAMIMPWLGVFAETDLHLFLMKHIVPKLQLCLTELIINPMDQDMGMRIDSTLNVQFKNFIIDSTRQRFGIRCPNGMKSYHPLQWLNC